MSVLICRINGQLQHQVAAAAIEAVNIIVAMAKLN
jgi:hypothetical protein